MKNLKSIQIRNLWIDFFKEKEHLYVNSKSLIPHNDNSLLWINSGVATLKNFFNGSENPPSPRLVNIQRSLRTNDIENVGLTSRHHTLFEMLGNFSIGDYFKEDAVKYGIEFLTNDKWLNIDLKKLYFTVFEEDEITYQILINNNISKSNIIKAPKSTNFWDMGQGPCGPNCEIFYDRGEKFDKENIGLDLIKYDYDNNERYIEIWNIVFSEFNNDGNNNYTLLPRKNIDTGAGFERLVSLSQNGYTNFDSDLFLPIIKKIEEFTNFKYNSENYFINEEQQTKINIAFKVISDHIRAVSFAINDGAYPSNESRGYVLRRLIRRSIIFANKLNIEEIVLYKLVSQIVSSYKDFYPQLVNNEELITNVIKSEEEQFAKTMYQGQKRIQKLIKENNNITIKDAFILYDTYGFPFEILVEMAQEYNIEISEEEFNKELDKQKELSRKSSKVQKGMSNQIETFTKLNFESDFIGYDKNVTTSKIRAIFDNHSFYNEIPVSKEVNVIFDITPFYATMGGQVCDTGVIKINNTIVGEVTSVIVGPNKEHIHNVIFKNDFNINDNVVLEIDLNRRNKISSNHTTTHLVHRVLFDKLGDNLKQAGSYQDSEKSRFDFTVFNNFDKLELINLVDTEVNKLINSNMEVMTTEKEFKEAKKIDGLFAEFEANYTDLVRVVSIGNYSYELCGGTHISNTGEAEGIFVRNISSKGSNIYRIEFITGTDAIAKELSNIKKDFIDSLSKINNDDSKKVIEKVNNQKDLNQKFITKINEEIISIKKEYKKNKKSNEQIKIDNLTCEIINDVNVFVNIYANKSINELRSINDTIKSKYDTYLNVVLNESNKNTIIISSSENINAKSVFDNLSVLLKSRGGGKPTMLQGSFEEIASIEEIKIKIKEVL